MASFSHQGLDLSWAEPVGRTLRVLAGPAGPGNVLRVLARVGNGPEQAIPAMPSGIDPETGMQVFTALLPEVPLGKELTWRPVLQNGLRRVDPGTLNAPKPDAKPPLEPHFAAPFPVDPIHVARVTVPLADPPIVVGDTPDGLRIIYPLGTGGTVKGPHINGTVVHVGGDWMRIRPDGIGIVAVRALVTLTDGAQLMAEYSGIADFGPTGHADLLAGTPRPQTPIRLTPTFLTSSPKWDWVNRIQYLGIGHVTMDTLLVEYDLYALGPLPHAPHAGAS